MHEGTTQHNMNASHESGERNPLRVGKAGVQALLVEAEKLDHEAGGRIQREIPAENRAGGVRFADAVIEEQQKSKRRRTDS